VNFYEKIEKIVIFTLEKRKILSFPNIFAQKMKKKTIWGAGGKRKEKNTNWELGP
jgi:hypothetical protein